MGNTNQPFVSTDNENEDLQTQNSTVTVYEEEYLKAFLLLRTHQNFFTQFLHESPNFGRNLRYLFPNALQSPEDYFQMVIYLRKYDPLILSSKQAQQNCRQSTLLDRFFMICLGNLTFEKYKNTKLSKQKISELLLDYYRLFISNPKNSQCQKVLKFIGVNSSISTQQNEINARQFASKFREFFPHVHNYLRLYYYEKFHNTNSSFWLLKNFKSEILHEDAVLLALRVPELERPEITELYNSDTCGTSFFTLQKKIIGYTGPWMMLIKHSQKNLQGKKQTYVFGTYQNGPIKDTFGFQGDLTGFLFSLQPQIKFLTTGNGEGGENFFIIVSGDKLITKRKNGMGFGGNEKLEKFKIWIDQNIEKSSIYSGFDQTYGTGFLAGPGTQNLRIERIEIWGLGTEQNLRDQEKYWAQKEYSILKLRKVNRKQFLNEAEMYLQNMYSYKDQVADTEEPLKKRSPLKPHIIKNDQKKQNIETGKENYQPLYR